LIESDPFLIVNGDTLCDFDVEPMLAAHLANGAGVTMAVVPNPAPGHYHGILATNENVVTSVIPRGHSVPSWHFVGVQIVAKSVFAALEDGVPAETVSDIYQELIRSTPGRVRIWPVTTSFIDIGTPRDYLTAALRQADCVSANLTIPGSSTLTRCAVWPGAAIEEHVRLEDCIVAGPVVVPRGLECSSSILVPAAVARAGDRMRAQGGVAVYPLDIEHHARN
jgi:NDP-sugar pyrophosphorylase family protein